MNQQRSRRFRASQEAKEKEEARQESLLLWERELHTFNRTGVSSSNDLRNGSKRDRRNEEQKIMGFQRNYTRHSFHGPSGSITALLGREEVEHGSRVETGMLCVK